MMRVVDIETESAYILIASDTYIGLYQQAQQKWIGQLNW